MSGGPIWAGIQAVGVRAAGRHMAPAVGGPGGATSAAPRRATALGAVRLLSSTPQFAIIEFTLPPYSVRDAPNDGVPYVEVQAEGLVTEAPVGAPRLPQAGVLLGLPPQGVPRVTVLSAQTTYVPTAHPVRPQPLLLPARGSEMAAGGPGATPGPVRWVVSPASAIYQRDAYHPADIAHLAEAVWLRDQRATRLLISPFRYNPVQGILEIHGKMLLRVDFPPAAGPVGGAGSGATEWSGWGQAMYREILNAEVARAWRVAPRPDVGLLAGGNPLATEPGVYRIGVDADGLYRLTRDDLQAAGMAVATLDPRTLRLYEGEDEVAILVQGEADGRLDPGDDIFFYGQAMRGRYTRRNTYWLQVGAARGMRMSTRWALTGTVPAGTAWSTAHWEENRYYDTYCVAADGDHWYAARLRADLAESSRFTATVMLHAPSPSASTATLRVRLVGDTSDPGVHLDHRVQFAVNGRAVGYLEWDGDANGDLPDAVTATVTLPQDVVAMLRPGPNQVSLVLPGLVGSAGAQIMEAAWLDSVELDYVVTGLATGEEELVSIGERGARRYLFEGWPRAPGSAGTWLLDIAQPSAPVLLQGWLEGEARGVAGGTVALDFADDAPALPRYLALTGAAVRRPAVIEPDTPSHLRLETNVADYLVIAHADLTAALGLLLAHRAAQGLRTMLVDVQDVYDEFSYGRLDPEAIHRFIAYACQRWRVGPAYVLLVGDGTYDFLDHSGTGSRTFVPPYLGMFSPGWGETSADNRYAAVIGDDPLADVALGRLPVSSLEQAEAVVAKIVGYEQHPPPGDWGRRHLFVADVFDPSEGDFAAYAEAVYREYVTPRGGWLGQRAYLDDLDGAVARQAILAAWNQGAAVVSYVGHSSWHQWASISIPTSGPPRSGPTEQAAVPLFHLNDVATLTNGPRLPIVLPMTCFTGFFQHPHYPTLDETLLAHRGGGAVATWSPSGLGQPEGHSFLHRGFYQALRDGQEDRLGPVLGLAKLHLYIAAGSGGAYGDLLDTYHLFGDPAMIVPAALRSAPGPLHLPLVTAPALGR